MRCQTVDVEQIVFDYFFVCDSNGMHCKLGCLKILSFFRFFHVALLYSMAQHSKQATWTCNAIILYGFVYAFFWVRLLSFHLLEQSSKDCKHFCLYLFGVLLCVLCLYLCVYGVQKKWNDNKQRNISWCMTLWISFAFRQCGNYCYYIVWYLYSMRLPSFRVKHCIQLLMKCTKIHILKNTD